MGGEKLDVCAQRAGIVCREHQNERPRSVIIVQCELIIGTEIRGNMVISCGRIGLLNNGVGVRATVPEGVDTSSSQGAVWPGDRSPEGPNSVANEINWKSRAVSARTNLTLTPLRTLWIRVDEGWCTGDKVVLNSQNNFEKTRDTSRGL